MNVYQKINKIKAALLIAGINKTGENKFSNFSYFELSEIMPVIIKESEKIGLCSLVSFTPEQATLRLVDCDTAEAVEVTSPMSTAALKGCHDVQNLGAVQTYLRRYLYQAAFDVIVCDEIDSAPPRDDNPPRKPQPPQKPANNPPASYPRQGGYYNNPPRNNPPQYTGYSGGGKPQSAAPVSDYEGNKERGKNYESLSYKQAERLVDDVVAGKYDGSKNTASREPAAYLEPNVSKVKEIPELGFFPDDMTEATEEDKAAGAAIVEKLTGLRPDFLSVRNKTPGELDFSSAKEKAAKQAKELTHPTLIDGVDPVSGYPPEKFAARYNPEIKETMFNENKTNINNEGKGEIEMPEDCNDWEGSYARCQAALKEAVAAGEVWKINKLSMYMEHIKGKLDEQREGEKQLPQEPESLPADIINNYPPMAYVDADAYSGKDFKELSRAELVAVKNKYIGAAVRLWQDDRADDERKNKALLYVSTCDYWLGRVAK